MLFEHINKNQNFIGRTTEKMELQAINQAGEANLIIVYGRRRVGKTELLEQVFRERNILKFEGVEGADEQAEQKLVMRQLAIYAEEPLLKQYLPTSWLDIFDIIFRYIQKGVWTLYFEEVQWLAAYQDNFINQLKIAWDNHFRRNPNLIVILCGSSPSFMIKHVVRSKSLYNRSQHEMHLQEFSVQEAREFLPKKSKLEVMNAYLTVGGIPEYLKKLKKSSSIFTSLCKESFLPHSFFSTEYERIFVSSLAQNTYYKATIDFLSRCKFSTREAISKQIGLESGGRLTELLEELELCGFIEKYAPYNLKKTSNLARYCIKDSYLQFFFKFIQPNLHDIQNGRYLEQPTNAIKTDDYQKWLGYSFERFCRRYHYTIAKLLGFSSIKYQAGTFYNRATNKNSSGYQIDLLFDRSDHVITICEIKYTQEKTGTEVIDSFAKKLSHFQNKKRKTLHKVLISSEGADAALKNRNFFDVILTLDDLLP